MRTSSPLTTPAPASQLSPQEAAATSKAGANTSFSSDKTAGSAQQSCPKCQDKKVFCDIQSLTLTDTVSGRKVVANIPAGRRPSTLVPVGAPGRAATLYPSHDFVLELMADCYEGDTDPTSLPDPEVKRTKPPKPSLPEVVQLKIDAVYQGKCANNNHPFITLRSLNSDADLPQMWKVATPPTIKLLSQPGPGDPGGPPYQWARKWVSPFWFFANDVKELEVEVSSCGSRAQGDPNGTLKGLIRIYRNDVYSLSCTIPAFAKIAREQSAQADAWGGGVERKESFSASLVDREQYDSSSSIQSNRYNSDVISTTSNTRYDGDRTRTKSEEAGTKDGKAYRATSDTSTSRSGVPGVFTTSKSLTQSDGTGEAPKLVSERERELNATVSLKRNGHELDFTKFVNDIINLEQRITKAWNDIQHWVPKIGWSLSFELSILEGTIAGEWGHRAVATGKAESALWVDRFYNIKFDCKVLAYKAEASFGIDFNIPLLFDWFGDAKLLEIILKATGTLEGEAKLQATLCGKDAGERMQFNGNSVAKIKVKGRITALGVTYEAEGGVMGGIQIDGVLTGSLEKAPNIEARVFWVQTKIYAFFVNEKKNNKKSDPYERIIFEERTIWTGTLLHEDSTLDSGHVV